MHLESCGLLSDRAEPLALSVGRSVAQISSVDELNSDGGAADAQAISHYSSRKPRTRSLPFRRVCGSTAKSPEFPFNDLLRSISGTCAVQRICDEGEPCDITVMDRWFQVTGKPHLFKALTEVCDNLEVDFENGKCRDHKVYY